MLRRLLLLTFALMPAACASLPISVPDTARLQPGALGTGLDPDVTAINLAQWAFADPARTRFRPIDAARAAAAMDYIAGELNTSPRWANIPATTQIQLLQGRQELRAALFISPRARSQSVVDRLIATADALNHDDQAAALQDLSGPTFTAPPQAVLARLYNLPYVKMANIATMNAGNEMFRPSDNDWM